MYVGGYVAISLKIDFWMLWTSMTIIDQISVVYIQNIKEKGMQISYYIKYKKITGNNDKNNGSKSLPINLIWFNWFNKI